jgi:hypothetical protein
MTDYLRTIRQSLAEFRAQERSLSDQLARIRKMITMMERELGGREAQQPRQRRPRRAPVQVAMPLTKTRETDTGKIEQWVKDHPGHFSSKVADMLTPMVSPAAGDRRKVVLTRLGQLVKQGRLSRDHEGRLYPPGYDQSRNGNGQGVITLDR